MLPTYDGSELVVEVVGGDEMESLKKVLDAARVTYRVFLKKQSSFL